MHRQRGFMTLLGLERNGAEKILSLIVLVQRMSTHRHFNFLNQRGFLNQGLQTQVPAGAEQETLVGEVSWEKSAGIAEALQPAGEHLVLSQRWAAVTQVGTQVNSRPVL